VDPNLIPADRVGGLEGSFLGALTRIVVSGKLDWRVALPIVVCALTTSYYFSRPLGNYFAPGDANAIGTAGFLIGLTAMQILTGFMKVATQFGDQPWVFLRHIPFLSRFAPKDDNDGPSTTPG